MKRILQTALICLTLLSLSLNSPAEESTMVTVEWYGHSCFLLTLENGYKILLDPFDSSLVPYEEPQGKVNVILSTHDHFDHNAVNLVSSDFILRATGSDSTFFGSKKGQPFEGEGDLCFDLGGTELRCQSVPSFHDNRQGELRGVNGMLRLTVAGMTFVHLGDLGQPLTAHQAELLKPVDVLFVPVGGYYTIDVETAQQAVADLQPKIVIPMHYKTAVLEEGFPIEGVESFLKGYDNVMRNKYSDITLRKKALPAETTIQVLKYHGQN